MVPPAHAALGTPLSGPAPEPFWWHSIDLGEGVVTEGWKKPTDLAAEWAALGLGPDDLAGRSVLDIGAWDGWFSFEAERLGAARVVALDHYVWSLDLVAQQRYWQECREGGVAPEPYHTVPGLWQPEALPGKVGFDTARAARGSRVESVVADFMATDLGTLGTFDVVLYLGVLYHMRHPLLALERVAQVTGKVAVIETEAVAVAGAEHHGLCEFFETNELASDVSNWWAPNLRALAGMCRAAGFARVEWHDHGRASPPPGEPVHRFRVVVKAWK